MKRLVEILNKSNLADYQIVQKETVSHQAFFIKQQLDQHRISSVTHTKLTIYVDSQDKSKRGSATKEIYPNETDEEIRKDIESMKFDASLAMNKYYPLVEDQHYFEEKEDFDLVKSLENVVKAVQSIEDTETEKINSYEIFVDEERYHIYNSKDVDVTFNKTSEMVEIVINSLSKEHEVEVYHMIEAGADQTSEAIRQEILEVFKKASDRSKAVPAKKMSKAHVLISGSDLKEFFDYFRAKINAQMIYGGMSQNKVGDVIQKGDDCDKITLKAVKEMNYSNTNLPYSLEGVKASNFTILDNGKYVNNVGSARFAYYLGLNDVKYASNFTVEPGSKSIEEMKKDPYLEIAQFSSFQVDTVTGDFGGEFRLAYYYDGNSVTPVTAGSVTINMNDVLDHIYLSKESKQYNDCIIPEVIELFDIEVAGQE